MYELLNDDHGAQLLTHALLEVGLATMAAAGPSRYPVSLAQALAREWRPERQQHGEACQKQGVTERASGAIMALASPRTLLKARRPLRAARALLQRH